jgi:hypothetical protein
MLWAGSSAGRLLRGQNVDQASPAVSSDPPPLVFRARDILRTQVLRGPDYTIDETVVLNRQRFEFHLKTRWGSLKADGLNMLDLRLSEMRAIAQARALSKDSQFLDGLLNNVGSTRRGVRALLTNPATTVLQTPLRVGRMLDSRMQEADRRAGSSTRRQLAVQIGCDPETTNPILKRLLDQLALRKGLGSLAGKAGMSIALPGLGLLPASAELSESVALQLPHEVNRKLDQDLAKIDVHPQTRRDFLSQQHFTTTQRVLLVALLKQLPAVENREVLLEIAAGCPSEGDALRVLQMTEMMLQLNAQSPIRRFAKTMPPIVECAAAQSVLIMSVDYLSDSPRFQKQLSNYRKLYPEHDAALLTTGHVDPTGRALLERHAIRMIQIRAQ